MNTNLLIFNLPLKFAQSASQIYAMFKDSKRIKQVHVFSELNDYQLKITKCLIKFQSNSAARKTLETLKPSLVESLDIYWMNQDGLVTGQAAIEIIGEDKEMLLQKMAENVSVTGQKIWNS